MALNRDDLTSDKGNIGYGTMVSIPEPTEGSAGDLAAEAASAGIVNTDASAELAKQVPDIVVPLNPEVRGDDQFITNEGSDSDRDIDTKDPTGIAKLDVSNIITKDRAISYGLSQINPLLGLAYTAYNYFKGKADDKRQAVVDLAETARLDDTPENAGYATESDKIMAEGDIAFGDTRTGTGTQDYDEYSDTPTYSTPAPTYSYEGSDEQDEDTNYAPAPTQTYTPTETYYHESSDSNSGDSYGGSGQETQDNMYASGGIVARLRKNKQNTRIHDRRKRLAMGGITSLHG